MIQARAVTVLIVIFILAGGMMAPALAAAPAEDRNIEFPRDLRSYNDSGIVVAGAVAGGGLTVIANAPNPAGQAILKEYFENGVSPMGLLKGALLPTIIVWLVFFLMKF